VGSTHHTLPNFRDVKVPTVAASGISPSFFIGCPAVILGIAGIGRFVRAGVSVHSGIWLSKLVPQTRTRLLISPPHYVVQSCCRGRGVSTHTIAHGWGDLHLYNIGGFLNLEQPSSMHCPALVLGVNASHRLYITNNRTLVSY
jgi:hypothetical protein